MSIQITEVAQEVTREVVKATPPVTVGALHYLGVSLSDVVLATTLVYTVFQLYFLLRDKWWRQRDKKDE